MRSSLTSARTSSGLTSSLSFSSSAKTRFSICAFSNSRIFKGCPGVRINTVVASAVCSSKLAIVSRTRSSSAERSTSFSAFAIFSLLVAPWNNAEWTSHKRCTSLSFVPSERRVCSARAISTAETSEKLAAKSFLTDSISSPLLRRCT